MHERVQQKNQAGSITHSSLVSQKKKAIPSGWRAMFVRCGTIVR
jgi:hypothetical protein